MITMFITTLYAVKFKTILQEKIQTFDENFHKYLKDITIETGWNLHYECGARAVLMLRYDDKIHKFRRNLHKIYMNMNTR